MGAFLNRRPDADVSGEKYAHIDGVRLGNNRYQMEAIFRCCSRSQEIKPPAFRVRQAYGTA